MFEPYSTTTAEPRTGDTVTVVRGRVNAGAPVRSGGPAAVEDIPVGHKVALLDLAKGDTIVKFGRAIGTASAPIPAGALVHVHNVEGAGPAVPMQQGRVAPLPAVDPARFLGYRRTDGRVGTRNFIAVIIVGNCAATAARLAADHFDESRLADYPNVDGVVACVHTTGCGMEMTGEPMDLLRRTLSGYARNPNVFGTVFMALGCERNNLGAFLENENLKVGDQLKTVTIQDVGGVANAIAAAKDYVEAMLPEADKCRREPVSAEHLVVGLQSSTVDGLSGLTVNPVLGRVADWLIAQGGTVIASETPELIGCEAALLEDTPDEPRQKLLALLDEWRERSAGRDTALSGRLPRSATENGISTRQERGMDALPKYGRAPISAVRRYAEPLNGARGLVFMDSPDYDPVSITGQIATGSTMTLMGAASGTTWGSLPAPSLKLASSSEAYRRCITDMDVDCGPALDADAVDEIAMEVTKQLLDCASGRQTKSEFEGMGETEFVPWPIGVLA